MSAAVRRMVCDIQFRWLLIAALMALAIPLLDGLWLMRPGGGMPLGAAFLLGLPATTVTAVKLPVWRLLPVSRRQIGHAQWWLGVGATLTLILSGLALAVVVVVGVAGAPRASPTDVLALAGGQCAIGLALSLLPLLSSVSRKRLGPWAAALITFLWVAIFAVLAFSAPVLTPLLRITLPLAGAIAIAAAIATFVFSPTALNEPMIIGRPARRRAGRLAGSGMTGWAGLWRPFLAYTAGLAIISIGLFIGLRLMTGATDPIATAMGMGVLAMAPIVFGAMVRQSARALRGVPMSAASLTSVLLGAMAAAQLLAFAALYLVCRLCDEPAKMLALLPLVIGFGGCGLGAMLRRKGAMTIALSWPVFILTSDLLFRHSAFAPASMAVGLAALLAGWLWIYFELSRGRGVYQPQAASGLTWRGL